MYCILGVSKSINVGYYPTTPTNITSLKQEKGLERIKLKLLSVNFYLKNKLECKYGASCYQTKLKHMEMFYHPSKGVKSPQKFSAPVIDAKASVSDKNSPSPAKLSGKVCVKFFKQRTRYSDKTCQVYEHHIVCNFVE